MAVVTGFSWPLECEVHVLSGMTTQPLRDLLRVTIDNSQPFALDNMPLSVQTAVGLGRLSFEPVFKQARSNTTTAQGNTLVHGNGVDFELETGRVIALPVLAGQRRMRNFLVWAELEIVEYIKDTEEMPIGDDHSVLGVPVGGEAPGSGSGSGGSGGSSTGPATPVARTALTVIRIHVHDRIRNWWPTPGKLRVVSGSAGSLPRLLAEFDDGVAADISDWPGVIEGLRLDWTSADPARVQVDASTGLLRSISAPSTPAVDIRATLNHPALPPGFAPSAPVSAHVVTAWSQARPVTFIAGPGPRRHESATNILFLADGFVAGEEARFRELVARLANLIVSREDIQPFKLLRESINFWGLFLASEESGTTLLSEHLAPPGNAAFKLDEMPDADLEHETGPLTLERLIRLIGLPVPTDFGAGESDADAFARLVSFLANDFVLPMPFNVDLATFVAWRRLAGRGLVESRDTLFAVQAGGRPFVGRRPSPSPSLDSRRIEDDDIAALVGALYCDVKDGGSPQRVPVGRVWERPSPVRRGKDAGLVCVLSRAASFGAATTADPVFGPKHVLAKLWRYNGTEDEIAARQTGRATFVLRPSMVNPAHGASPNVALPVVHEIGHVFGLVDEYGGKRPTEQVEPPKAFPNGQWRYELFRRPGDPLGDYDPATTLPTEQRISPSKIVWAAWPRLRAAGELVAPPAIVGTTVRVQLRIGHALNFAVDQYVKLRQRPLLGGAGGRNSPAMRITEVIGDEVRLERAPSFTSGDILDFDVVADKPAPVLILPLRRPGAETPARREQGLVAPEILAHIGESGGPLNAAADNPLRPCTPAESPVASQFPRNLPATLTRTPAMEGAMFRWPSIVGLYQGGIGVNCGAYHPAGDCMMRGASEESWAQRTSSAATTEFRPFCHVCRYWLVDRIDPSKHRELDDLYDPSYPGPRPYE